MQVPRIFTPQALSANTLIDLEPQSSRHLARVLRRKAGDALIVFNGEGGEYPASIVEVSKQLVRVQTQNCEQTERETPLAIHLAIGLSKGERMDHIVQKATELGVTEITPLFTERSAVKLSGPRADKKVLHWQQIAISACEQCGRNHVPVVHAPKSIEHWADIIDADCKLVLHHRADTLNKVATPENVALLIGPEGGLSPAEISSAEKEGFIALKLGPRVLRTETAPIAALAVLQARWGDMSI